MASETRPPNQLTTRWKKIIAGAVGTLLIAAAGNAAWELLFKPGLSRGGRVFLTVITLGSSWIRDSAYESAALDPTGLPSLLLMLMVWFMPGIAVVGYAAYLALEKYRTRVLANKVDSTLPEDEWVERAEPVYAMFNRRAFLIIAVLFVISFLLSIATVLVIAQSVTIHRVFHANIAICAPYVSDAQLKTWESRFASIKSKAEYLAIQNEMQQVAEQAHRKLRQESLW